VLINPYPTPRSFGKIGNGPCVSLDVLRAAAVFLGVSLQLDDQHRPVVDGVIYSSLADADQHLEALAARRGLLVQLAIVKEAEEARLVIAQREARISIAQTRAAERRAGIARERRSMAEIAQSRLPEALRF
jgi:hypothetical protein